MQIDPADMALRLQAMNQFRYKPTQRYKLQARPDGGVDHVPIVDDVNPAQVDAAMRPKRAAVWLRFQVPDITHISILPSSEIAVVSAGGEYSEYLIGCFWASLRAQNFDIMRHPNFSDYARGIMALRPPPCAFAYDASLVEDYPPRKLKGLNGDNLRWSPHQ